MEFVDVLWGFWNGLTAWIVLLVHVFGGWPEYPVFDMARNGNGMAWAFWSALARHSWAPRAQARARARW